ncbi:MAG: flagellar export protein FliJ [Peptococcaceae bacterium]|nr:flagellar export protein FliJ [Peptococcaceae bacterium]
MALRYHFRLQSVLRLREYKESQCKEEMGRCVQRLYQAEKLRDEIEEKIRRLTGELRELTLRGKELYLVEFYDNFILYQRILLERQIQLVAQRKKELAYARMRLVEAMKDRKILNKLDEKLYRRYLFDMDKAEQAQMDELALTRYE